MWISRSRVKLNDRIVPLWVSSGQTVTLWLATVAAPRLAGNGFGNDKPSALLLLLYDSPNWNGSDPGRRAV